MKRISLVTAAMLSIATVANAKDTITFYSGDNPNAPYSVATQVGNTVFLSGQLPLDENGQLPEGMPAQAKQVMENVKSAGATAGVTMADIFKCTVMIDDIALWGDFNTVYVAYFEKGKLPARSAFGADGLAKGAMLEVECWAHKG